MAQTSFGGIRARGGAALGVGPFAAQAGVAAGVGMRQAGSPYSTAAPVPMIAAGPPAAHVLLVLVLLETLALVALRHGFRHHHGG